MIARARSAIARARSAAAGPGGTIPIMRVSFIVPAFNEAAQIQRVVQAIRDAATAEQIEHEILVVDDASTDATARLAAEAGATVLSVEHRQIAATRNAGARAAKHTVLVFVDGDTFVDRAALQGVRAALERGAVGGGALCRLDDASPLAHMIVWLGTRSLALAKTCGGAFLFVRRDVFEQIGGFDEQLFAAEEVELALSIRRHGRFVVLRHPVTTSGRKFRNRHPLELLGQLLRLAIRGRSGVASREGLDLWYDGRR